MIDNSKIIHPEAKRFIAVFLMYRAINIAFMDHLRIERFAELKKAWG